jgi:hypothetical protein
MLVICLDWSIRNHDAARTYAFAQRVVTAKNPSRFQRRVNVVLSILFWPLMLFGYGRGIWQEADAFDKWSQWAQAYVEVHASTQSSSE